MNTANFIRRAMAIVFLGALILGSIGSYLALQNRALEEAAHQSRVLLSTAQAIRAYTVDQVRPHLYAEDENIFLAESVPSFAAQAIFARVTGEDASYTYREAALNPTNPADLPVPFETQLINSFRQDGSVTELTGMREVDGRNLFYLARPIRIEDPACLSCHSTPDIAPAAMVARYGPNNGFGWQMDEVVGVQVLTVPISEELRGAYEVVLMLAGGFLVIFIIAYALIAGTIQHNVVNPLRELAEAAEDASVGADGGRPLPETGSAEIQALARAIERLRTSLMKALMRGEP